MSALEVGDVVRVTSSSNPYRVGALGEISEIAGDRYRLAVLPNGRQAGISLIGDWSASALELVAHGALIREVQLAQDAALGDSNDAEIDLLRSALELALHELGLELPESREASR